MRKRYIYSNEMPFSIIDTQENKSYPANHEDICQLLNELNHKIDTMTKTFRLMEYQLKVQDRIIDEYENRK